MFTVKRSERGYSLIEVLFVVGLIAVVTGISVPMVGRTMAGVRLTGSARALTNAIAVAKIRAAATFSRVRLYADRAAGTYRVEVLDRTPDPDRWTTEGGATSIGSGVTYGFAPVTTAPAGSESVIGSTPECLTDLGVAIPDTSCITFNSRGIPVDVTGAPTRNGVLYLGDGTEVFAVAVASTGMVRLWRTLPTATPQWTAQ